MTTKRRGSIAALIAGLVMMAQPAAAFKKHEHEALSNLALAVALESLRGEMPAGVETKVRSWFLRCSPDAKARLKACDEETSQCVPFGLLTQAVDRVLRPEGLIPSKRLHLESFKTEAPQRCDEPRSPTTARMKQELQKASQEGLFNFTSCRAEKKIKHVWNWLIAVHQNSSHFEHCAASKYNALHRLAIEIATDSRQTGTEAEPLFVAFVAEAVALHFLQDSFAPGHLLTPRSGSMDILARGMHNAYNRAGASVSVHGAEPWLDLETALWRVLQEDLQSRPKTVAAALQTFSLTVDAVSAGRLDCGSTLPDNDLESSCYFGDGSMLYRGGRKESEGRTRQAVDLILLSAASIREVLLAGGTDRSLRVFFQDWFASPNEERTNYVEGTLMRPWLFVAPSDAEAPPGQPLPSSALASFKPSPGTQRDRFATSLRNSEFSVAYVIGDSSQESGLRGEVGLPFGNPGQRDIRYSEEDEAHCREDPSACYLGGSPFGLLISWNLQGERWPDYEALGLTARPWFIIHRHPRSSLDFMVGLEGGWKWYFSEERSPSRAVWGGHVAAGLGILFLDLGFERGSMLVGKDHKRNSNYSIGLRFQIP